MKTTQRIRQAMVRVVLQQGYDKTTMHDIAEAAGVARSTLYTKWRTKEALFADVLWRESEAYFETWYTLVERDPEGGTLRGIYRNALRAVRENPLILALYTQNRFVMGSFIHDETYAQAVSGLILWNVRWLGQLQANGLIRADINAETIAWIEVVFRQGLLTLPVDTEAHTTIDSETLLNQFFAILAEYLTTGTGLNSDTGKAVLREYIDEFKAHVSSQD